MEKKGESGWVFNRSLVNLLTVVVGLVAAYFVTIQSIKIEMAAKAEGGVVETLEKKLTNFEVILKETVVSKEQFYEFSREIRIPSERD